MKRRKIFVTGTRGVPNIMGGVETHSEELFPRLVELGYDVTVVRRSSYVKAGVDAKSGVKDGVWKDVKLLDLKSPKKKSFEAIIHTMKAVIMARWMGAKIVHIHAIGPALVTPVARLLGLKVVFTHHGPDYDRDKWGFAAKTMLKLGERMGCMFANHVIVISDVIRNLIASKYGRTKNVHLIYNGVPEPEVCSMPEYFEELGIEEGRYILGMCRFVPEKHLHDLVDAFIKWQNGDITKTEKTAEGSVSAAVSECSSGLGTSATSTSTVSDADLADPSVKNKKNLSSGMTLEDRKKIKLVLAGDTDFEDDYSRGLKQKARKNGVVLTGFVRGQKLHSLLTHALCYSLPSSHEGLPIALLEAMSYQLPVITSAIPANLEVGLKPYRLNDNDDDNLLDPYHEVGDVEALAEKLEAICSRPLERVKYDMGKYDWDRIAKEVSEVYESL